MNVEKKTHEAKKGRFGEKKSLAGNRLQGFFAFSGKPGFLVASSFLAVQRILVFLVQEGLILVGVLLLEFLHQLLLDVGRNEFVA